MTILDVDVTRDTDPYIASAKECLDRLGGVDLTALSDAALSGSLDELITLRRRLDAEVNRRVGAADARALGLADAAPSTQSWLRGRFRLSANAASAEVRTARRLRELPTTAAAWAAGEIDREHVHAIGLLAKDTSLEATQKVEDRLVDVARIADPLRFATELRHWREALRRTDGSDEGRAKDESSPAARRELSITTSLDGMASVRGWLTPEAAEVIRAALDPLSAPLPSDERTAAQRRHDALHELAARGLAFDDVAPGHRVRPQLMAMAGLDDLLDSERSGLAELGYGGLLEAPALQRIACDSTVRRVLLGPDGEVLDLGRETRTITPAQWRALVVRDGGCVVPGCDRPAAWCEGHHVIWWTNGGPTDLDNLVLLCLFHHTLVHDAGWTLLRDLHCRWTLRRPDGTLLPTEAPPTRGMHRRRGSLLGANAPPDRVACTA